MRPRALLERPSAESGAPASASAWLRASLVAGDPKMASVHALWAQLRCLASFARGLDNEGERHTVLELCRFLKIRNCEFRFLLPLYKMRNCELNNNSFAIHFTTLLAKDSGIDYRKKAKK